ncbi:MAG: hypothetical protein ACE149_05775 [Armatimonadota bacterium]
MDYLVLVIHSVRDYRRWRPVFDAHEEARALAGMTEPRVFRNVNQPDELVIEMRTSNLRLAREFLQSDDLKARMAEGGVVSPPTIYFLEAL